MKRTQGKVVHSRGTVWNNKLGYSNVQMGWRIENDDGEVIQLGCKSFRQTLISRILLSLGFLLENVPIFQNFHLIFCLTYTLDLAITTEENRYSWG